VVATTTRLTAGGGVLDQRTYAHDRRSNKTQRVDVLTGLEQEFVYDSSARMLRSEWTPLGGAMVPTDYALDGVGNRGSVAIGGLGTQYTLSGPDQPVNQYTLVGSQAREYDANGNLVSRTGNSGPGGGGTGSASATYDYRNQMVSWYDVGTGMLATYGYDCIGRRISKTVGGTTTQFVWAGQRVIEERVGGAVQASYAHGAGLDEVLNWRSGTTDRYFATDDMGSVVKLLDATGAVEESYEYGDFGRLLSGTTLQPLAGSAAGNRCFYTGREHDWESGLHQHRMRYMEPGVGRFTTRDPIGIWGDASNAGNGYTYAASNPWTWCDPSGCFKAVGYPLPDDGKNPLLLLGSYLGPQYQTLIWLLQIEYMRDMAMRYDREQVYALDANHGCSGVSKLVAADALGLGHSQEKRAARASNHNNSPHGATGHAKREKEEPKLKRYRWMGREWEMPEDAGWDDWVDLDEQIHQSVKSVALEGASLFGGRFVFKGGRWIRRGVSGIQNGSNKLLKGTKTERALQKLFGPNATRGGSSLLTHIPAAGRKASQLARRGWTREAINETVNNPFTTRAATNRATGNPATAFFRKDGSHVIRDNVTGDLVQVSDRTNPANWIPDASIVNPYLPGK
jgi:RHS repeat-associated protein